jgi:hypothetical protein
MLDFRWKGVIVDLMVWDRGTQSCSVHGRIAEASTRSAVVGVEVIAGGAGALTDSFGEFALVLRSEWQPRQLRVRTPAADVVCALPEAL